MVRKPREFFDLHVKSLVLVFGTFFDTYDVQFVRTIAVLKLCSNVETLALPGFARALHRNALRELRKFMTSPSLAHRLHIRSSLFPRDQRHLSRPIPSHLPAGNPSGIYMQGVPSGEMGLRYFPQLTHLSVYMPYGEIAYCKWAEGVLAVCSQQFRIFILWVELEFPPTEDEANAICNGDVDSRLVLGYTDMEEDEVEMRSPIPTRCCGPTRI
jgi:hypothetical protein